MIHELKTFPEYFEAVIKGEKLFEVRKNDRPFHKGDLLALNEYNPETKCYSGRSCLVYVDYILNDKEYCKNDYVIMSIKACEVTQIPAYYNPLSQTRHGGIPLATNNTGES